MNTPRHQARQSKLHRLRLEAASRLMGRWARFGLALALVAAVCASVMSPARAAVVDPFTKVFDTNVNGDIQIRGNTLMTCPSGASGCNGANNALNNNDFSMVYVDIDSDGTTKNSSSATVAMPSGSSVLYAALVWGANTKAISGGGLSADVDASMIDKVKIATPDQPAYRTVTAGRLSYIGTAPNPYQGFADVTSMVRAGGNGTYTVAGVQAATGTDRYAGWSLAIAYADAAAPLRNLTLFRGYGSILGGAAPETVDITVDGFTTPKNGAVRTTLGAVTYEGDRNYTGDQLQLNSTPLSDALNPSNNVFNSTISARGVDQTGRSPQLVNQLGFDADTFNADGILANGATSATIRVNSSNENYYPGLITFATDLYSPQLNGTKTVTDINGGSTVAGDVLEYSVDVRNDGIDDAELSHFTDSMPTGTTYVAGSMRVDGVALTDGNDTDAGKFVAAKDQLQILLGPNGLMAPNDVHTVTFRATVNSGVANGLNITNVAVMDYVASSSRLALAAPSNAVINVVPPSGANNPPAAILDAISVSGPVGNPVNVDVRANDSDPDGDAITVTDVTQPGGGTAAIVGGQVVYTPKPTFAGTDAFTYTISDGNGGKTTGTVRVTVLNRKPTAVNDTYTVQAGATQLAVLANDTDPDGEALHIRSVPTNSVQGGTLSITGSNVVYTPAPGFRGSDTFKYLASDPRGEVSEATVTITVVNSPPVADDEAVTTPINVAVTIPVLVGDVDADADTLAITAVSTPLHGNTGIFGSSVVYTPAPGFVGTDSFTYTIDDGHGGTDIGNVTVNVSNSAPSAVNDAVSTPHATAVTYNVVANDTDFDNDSLSLVPDSLTDPTDGNGVVRGTAEIDLDSGVGFVRYSPPTGWHGTVTFDYRVTDPHGGEATATVTVTVNSVAPSAVGATVTSNRATAISHDVALHDGDPDGGTVTVTNATVPAANGTVTFTGSTINFVPAPGLMGPVVISYTITDDEGQAATATLTVNVNNRAPLAVADRANTPRDTAVSIDVLRNDSDPDTDALTIDASGVGSPVDGNGTVQGTVAIDGRRLVYSPPAGFKGTVTFTYVAKDPFGGTATGTVTVDVLDQAFQSIPAKAGETNMVPVTIVGADGKSYRIIDVAKPVGGRVTIEDGELKIIPDEDSDGDMTFSATLVDPDGKIVTQVINVAVTKDTGSADNEIVDFMKSFDETLFTAGGLAVTGLGIATMMFTASVLTGVGAVFLLMRRRDVRPEPAVASVSGRRFK